jgi:hypothetical protein
MTFHERLREHGVACRVEIRDRLAVLIPDADDVPISRADVRRLAREAGFTHVALELDPDGAALPRD